MTNDNSHLMGPANGTPDGDRPLLRKPEPEYVSSREMLDVLWRRSPYAPVDEAFDHGIDYIFEIDDPEIHEFERWLLAVFTLGLLRASVKGDDGSYHAARIGTPVPDDLVEALRKNLPISVHVRTVSTSDKGIEPAFPNLTPEAAADSPLWFKRADVEILPCHDADDMREVVRRAENDDPLADLDPELAAHIAKRRADALARMGGSVVEIEPAEADLVKPARRRGRPKTTDVLAYEAALFATLVDGGRGVTNPTELRDATNRKLIAAGNGGEDEMNKGLIPSPNTALRSAEKVWDSYMRGKDHIEPI